MSRICPKCQKSRGEAEKVVHKDDKSWLIKYCPVCKFNFDLEEFVIPAPPTVPQLNKKTKRFRFGLDRDEDI